MSKAQVPARTSDVEPGVPAVAAVPGGDAMVVQLRPEARDDVGFRPARRRRFGWKQIGFAVLVALPAILGAVYFGLVASDQYVAEARFGVRLGERQGSESGGILQSSSAATQIGLESNVVVQFAHSRQIVDALETSAGLRSLYARPEVDVLSRLDPAASAEDLVEYWRGKAYVFFDMTTGSVIVRVKAFTPADAKTLAAEVVRLSEELVNGMSQRSLADSLRNAKAELAEAEARLRRSREAIATFRSKEQVLDPTKQADANLGLVGKLKEDMTRLEAEYRTNRSYMADAAPTQRLLASRIAGLQEQIQSIDARLSTSRSSSADDALSRTIGEFDALESEKRFAERLYETSLDTLQKAQVAANRQAIYLQVFVQPSLPERPQFPRRLESIALTILAGFGAWILSLLVVASIRDHL